MRNAVRYIALFTTMLTNPVFAHSWGGQISVAPNLHTHSEPKELRGGRFAFRYLPNLLDQKEVHVFLEGSVARFDSDFYPPKQSLITVGLAPVVRMYMLKHSSWHPYFEFSVGGSWLSRSVLVERRLGGHWQFQDMVGLGVQWGEQTRYYAGLQALHYSNAHICEENDGVTVPLLLTVGTLQS